MAALLLEENKPTEVTSKVDIEFRLHMIRADDEPLRLDTELALCNTIELPPVLVYVEDMEFLLALSRFLEDTSGGGNVSSSSQFGSEFSFKSKRNESDCVLYDVEDRKEGSEFSELVDARLMGRGLGGMGARLCCERDRDLRTGLDGRCGGTKSCLGLVPRHESDALEQAATSTADEEESDAEDSELGTNPKSFPDESRTPPIVVGS